MRIKTKKQFTRAMQQRAALLHIRDNGTGYISFENYFTKHEVPAILIDKSRLIECGHNLFASHKRG